MATKKPNWKPEPDEHDYPAAADYLSLILPDTTVKATVAKMRSTALTHRKAKDLLRASRLPALAPDNYHVAKDLKKVASGQSLSPVLLVRGDLGTGAPLTIADGYHRVCASHHLNEDDDIPCRLVDFPAKARRG
jgi:hypothetical protein